jgi:membrane fusion protein, multidrug efflux system
VNEARLQAARAEFERSSEIAKTGAISRQELDKSRTMQEEALAALEAAKGNLRAHELTLSFCTIVAPIDGRAGRYNLSPGNLVTQDQTVLTTIVSLDPVYAYFDVAERTLLRMRKANVAGGPNHPEAGAEMLAFLNLADEKGFLHRGTVNFVGNHVDPSTGTISMRAVFANPESKDATRLYVPGMFVRVRLPIGKPHSALLVINPALGSAQGTKFVYVAGPNDVIERRRIETGALQEDGLRVIDSGLQPDDRVVVGDVRQVRPSMTIQPKLVPMPTHGPDE